MTNPTLPPDLAALLDKLNDVKDTLPRDLPALLNVRAVAKLLGCSERHVYRLSDGARMPQPLRLGSLVRWSRQAIEDWIAAGCPASRKGVK